MDELRELIRPHVRFLITKKGYRELKRGKTPKDSEDYLIAGIQKLFLKEALECLPEKQQKTVTNSIIYDGMIHEAADSFNSAIDQTAANLNKKWSDK